MPRVAQPLPLDELARLGADVFDHRVRPSLRPEDDGKFVAVDVVSGEYEIDANDYAAVTRLRARVPAADVWLERIGSRTTCRVGALWRRPAVNRPFVSGAVGVHASA